MMKSLQWLRQRFPVGRRRMLDSFFERSMHIASRRGRTAALFEAIDPRSFSGKTVLEVGCGHGHLGEELVKLGARVTSIDGRPENIQALRRKFADRPAFTCDLNTSALEQFGPVDIVLAFGLLYHLSAPGRFLASCSRISNVLLLETMVLDSWEPEIVWVEDHISISQALDRRGCRPSPAWVEQHVRSNGFVHIVDISSAKANWNEAGDHTAYDWEATGRGTWMSEDGMTLRKMWIASKHEIETSAGPIRL